ncbi:MAG: oligosaccharide flippase family protein [bacterium]|nr:oligosaccharide flippase family protein [bacterium]
MHPTDPSFERETQPSARSDSLLRGAAAVLGFQLLGLGLNFGLQVLLARSLGAESYGVYVYALRWLGLLAIVCQGGLAVGSLRFVPAYVEAGDWPHLAGFLKSGWRFVLVAGFAVAALAWSTVLVSGARLSPEMRGTLLVALIALPIYGLLQVWGSTLRALGEVVRSQLPSPVLRPLLLGVAVVAWLIAGTEPLRATTVMILNLTAVVALLALTARWLWRALPAELAGVQPRTRFDEWRRVLPPLMLQNLLGMAIQRLDILMIGLLLGPGEVALYAVAGRIAGLIAFGRKAVNAWAAPRISTLYARGERTELAVFVRQASRAIAGLSLPIAALILLASRQVLAAFGNEFVDAWSVLVILVAGHFATSFVGPASFLLSMTGGERTVVRVSTAIVVLTAGLLAVLIPAHGLIGAAVAAAVTRLGHHIALAVAAWRRTGARATLI